MLTHILCQSTQSYTRQIVDGKPRVLRIVHWEHPRTTPLDFIILESLRNRLQAHTLGHLVQHDLDEDTATRRSVFFGQLDALHDGPVDRVGGEEMTKEAGDITETVGFVAMDGVVVVGERLLEALVPDAVQLAEALSNETVEC